ncbi:MAG: spore coat protein U domain-containing protein [Geminicoccaceae bacterium]
MYGLNRNACRRGAALLLLALAPGTACACTVSAENLDFGIYDFDHGSSARPKIRVDCPAATDFTIGLTAPAVGSERYMLGPDGDLLFYQIFTDSTFSYVWGAGISIAPPVSGSSDGIHPSDFTLYAEAFKNQSGLSPGLYTAQVTVTLTF